MTYACPKKLHHLAVEFGQPTQSTPL